MILPAAALLAVSLLPVGTSAQPVGAAAQQRAAREADQGGPGDVPGLLRDARAAIAARRVAAASELIERAEARLLTRRTVATRAARPLAGGPAGRLAAARAALAAGDLVRADAEVAAVAAARARRRTAR